jgi:hypothetical protein
MRVQTFQRWVSLGLGLLWMASPGASRVWADNGGQGRPMVRISVYNDAGLKRGILLHAEEDAAAVFRRAGIEMEWKNCGGEELVVQVGKQCSEEVAYPARLVLRIERRPRGLNAEPLGIAYQSEDGQGAYCDVFLEPMEEVQHMYSVDLDSLVGHVVAHEVAHLLLGLHSHSADGLMRARWGLHSMEELKRGALEFNSRQSAAMVERLEFAQERVPGALATMAGDVKPMMMALPAECPNSH